MKSHEVIRESIRGGRGVKQVASELSVSASLVYKWCEPAGGADAAGTANPLDRVDALCRAAGSNAPLHWLCERFDGCFVENPPSERRVGPVGLLPVTRNILREFSDLLEVITRSTSDDGCVDAAEAERIRREWENLKRVAEQFVRACERREFEVSGTGDGDPAAARGRAPRKRQSGK